MGLSKRPKCQKPDWMLPATVLHQRQAELVVASLRPEFNAAEPRERKPDWLLPSTLLIASPTTAPAKRKTPRYTGFPAAVVDLIKARSGGWCEFWDCTCRAGERHHRWSRGSGGTTVDWVNWAPNGVDSCWWHNQEVEAEPVWADKLGARLTGLQRPATTPFLHRAHGWVLFNNLGGWASCPAPDWGYTP